MSDRERSRSPSASERKVVTISGDQSPPHGRPRDRENHDSPSRNNKIGKRSYSRSPSGGRSRKMSYRGDRGREERERGERERERGERGERRYRSRSRSRSAKRYKARYSHSRSRSHSRGRGYGRSDRSHSRSPMSSRRRHVGTRDNPTPSRCLGVFGLSVNTTESEIHHMFSKYGPVERVQIVIDAKARTGQSRGFCFVYFESTEDSKVAKEKCNGIKLGGKNIRVDYSITQRAHTPTPGIYMGKPTYMSSRQSWGDRGRARDRDDYYGYRGGSYRDRRSQSPPYYRRRRYERSRSRSYSPRRY
ncbi:transformer 2 [Carabus blaptoides fortunei]